MIGTVGLGSLAAGGVASAETQSNGGSIVDKIATTFNLNKDEVQKVFDEEREARKAQHEAKRAERLQGLVDDGTITAEQKTAIEAKLEELSTKREENREALRDMSEDERRVKMDEERESLEAWAKEQGLDLSKLRGVFVGGRGMHMGPPQDRM